MLLTSAPCRSKRSTSPTSDSFPVQKSPRSTWFYATSKRLAPEIKQQPGTNRDLTVYPLRAAAHSAWFNDLIASSSRASDLTPWGLSTGVGGAKNAAPRLIQAPRARGVQETGTSASRVRREPAERTHSADATRDRTDCREHLQHGALAPKTLPPPSSLCRGEPDPAGEFGRLLAVDAQRYRGLQIHLANIRIAQRTQLVFDIQRLRQAKHLLG